MTTRNPNGPKLKCPRCGRMSSEVVADGGRQYGAVWEGGAHIYRRLRECLDCHTRFTSVERVERVVVRPRKNLPDTQEIPNM